MCQRELGKTVLCPLDVEKKSRSGVWVRFWFSLVVYIMVVYSVVVCNLMVYSVVVLMLVRELKLVVLLVVRELTATITGDRMFFSGIFLKGVWCKRTTKDFLHWRTLFWRKRWRQQRATHFYLSSGPQIGLFQFVS